MDKELKINTRVCYKIKDKELTGTIVGRNMIKVNDDIVDVFIVNLDNALYVKEYDIYITHIPVGGEYLVKL